MLKLGVIGFGARAEGLLKNIVDFEMGAEVAAVCDLDKEAAWKHMRYAGFDTARATYYDDADEMLGKEKLDGVCIATNCNTHAEFAVKVMKHKIPMLLEKPAGISEEQLNILAETSRNTDSPVVVSFPLRYSFLCQIARKIIARGDLGQITHVEAVNNVSYGRVYYQSWYRDDKITGGLFLQKATHDLDYINYLLGIKPVQLAAMESKQIFIGDKPSGLKCENCEEYKFCPESPYVIKNDYLDNEIFGSCCSFAQDTGNHDSASILIKYENGVHAVYTQDFIARKTAGKRGAVIIGYKATMEFDWVSGILKVHNHRGLDDVTYEVKNNHLYHYGGDKGICRNFINVIYGREESMSTLRDGLLSARMCIKAAKSASEGRFYNI